MKKSKRSFELEEKEPESSKDSGLGFDLDDEEDEILDLEDIFELPDEDGEDDGGMDVEILDADLDDSDDKLSSDGDDIFGKDLLKGFPLDDEHDEDAGGRPTGASSPEPEEDILKDLSFLEDLESDSGAKKDDEDDEEDLLKGLSFDEPKAAKAKDAELSGNIIDEADLEALLAEAAATPVEEPAAPAAEVKPMVAAAAPAAALESDVPSLDDFVARIESKLVDTVREIVEARLPDIVRTVLQEEIERLRGEMK